LALPHFRFNAVSAVLSAPVVAIDALAADLRAAITGEVRFDRAMRAVYSADASNYRQVPIGVVLPRSVADIEAAMAVCRRHKVPILARGGGTSQNGQSVNVAVIIDCSKYLNQVLLIDPLARTALVEPGTVCDALRDAAEEHQLTFGPDPATHSRCTLGGMIGNNSCGAHSVMAGKTAENIEALEVLTYDGARFWVGPTDEAEFARIVAAGGRQAEIYTALKALSDKYADLVRARFPKIKRRVSGYGLDQLLPENGFNVARALVGTEGTCAFTLQAKARLVKSPQHRVILVLGYRDIYVAGDAVPQILPYGPIATEGLDLGIIGGLKRRGLKLDDIALLPKGDAWIMVEFGGDTPEEASRQAQALADHYKGSDAVSAWLIADKAMMNRIWTIRETGASATALAIDGDAPDPVCGWEDAAVDPLRLGDYLREFQALVDRTGYTTSLYGHFGDGCIHARINFDLRSLDGIKIWRGFLQQAAELVVKYGGSLSGEHGDGQAKAEFLPVMYGPELMQALREFKAIWDPEGKMNPGKVVDPYRVDENLRQGPDYKPVTLATRMHFLSREGDGFTRAIERCIGMGKCRSAEGGTMCPSYRVTGEERYSTRGRSRLLAEMLRGEVITDRWQSDEVREALDLCLACKGCKSDCPTHTDMASYKAEFMSHYHETKMRPRQAWFIGRIGNWAPFASALPWLSNFFTQTPGFAALSKFIAGVSQQRTLPRFAATSFRSALSSRPEHQGGRPVMLWPDTFTNTMHPEIGLAAVAVLEAAGCTVTLPRAGLCCGRPMYDFGFLDQAKAQLAQILDALAPQIEAGVPLIGLEPSCLSVFRDELLKFFPDDARAKKLAASTFMLAEYLEKTGYVPAPLAGKALVHGHCHQKAVMGVQAETDLLKKMGLAVSSPDTGCCGMAGSFGFHTEHYPLSIKAAEQGIFREVRKAGADTLIIANGFSCREQVEQGLGRRPLHIAEVLHKALQQQANG
jgi:FAD/FMN-containing dehydrogenase/Fe-S oxidoreductase